MHGLSFLKIVLSLVIDESDSVIGFNFFNFYSDYIFCLLFKRTHSRWSEQAVKLNDGTAPLPLLAAIHAKPDTDIMEFHG